MWREFVALVSSVRMFQLRWSAIGFATIALCGCLLAQVAVAADTGTPGTSTTTKTPTATTTTTTTTWGGLGWGIGIATDFDIGGARVNNASVVNNIVRVTDTSNNVGISFVLEAHYFLKDYQIGAANCPLASGLSLNCSDVAMGPFVAIEIGDGSTATPAANGPITAYALGWMVGLRHPTASLSQTSSWNFGIGLRVDPKSQVLGDGLVVNQPLPAGDSIRYKTEPRVGIMLLSSFSF